MFVQFCEIRPQWIVVFFVCVASNFLSVCLFRIKLPQFNL